MSWQSEIVLILRHLTDDLCSETWSDDRLEEVILVSAQLMQGETSFENTYTIDVDAGTMSPDPTTTSPRDDLFLNLTVLKAACVLMRGQLRDAAAREGVTVKDKMGEISLKGRFAAHKELMSSYCDAYNQAKLEYSINNIDAVRAIFNVVVGPNINTSVPWTRAGYSKGDSFFN